MGLSSSRSSFSSSSFSRSSYTPRTYSTVTRTVQRPTMTVTNNHYHSSTSHDGGFGSAFGGALAGSAIGSLFGQHSTTVVAPAGTASVGHSTVVTNENAAGEFFGALGLFVAFVFMLIGLYVVIRALFWR